MPHFLARDNIQSAPIAGPLAHATRFLRFEFQDGAAAGEPVEPVMPPEDPAGGELGGQADLYESPEFRDALAGGLRELLPDVLNDVFAQQPLEQDDQGDELDPYMERMLGLVERRMDARLAPILPTVQEYQDQQSQAQIGEMIGRIPQAQELGSGLPEDSGIDTNRLVEYAANGFLPDTESRHGPGERAVRAALELAAADLHKFADAKFQAGYQARNRELTARSDTREPVPVGAVEGVQISEAPRDVFEVADRFAARFNNE